MGKSSARMRDRVRDLSAVDSSDEARFGARVTPDPSGCWAWNGNLGEYGTFNRSHHNGMKREPVAAHRYAYMTLIGPIPQGHDLHHKCENKGCVNPSHLVPLTRADHMATHRGSADAYHPKVARPYR